MKARVPALIRTVAVASILLATGCTSVSQTTVQSIGMLFHKPDHTPSAQQVADSPYPQLLLSDRHVNGLLVLGYLDQDRQVWVAGTHAVYYLNAEGLLTGAAGPGFSYQASIIGNNPFAHLAQVQGSVPVQRSYDWMPGYHYGIQVSGQLQRIGSEQVQLPHQTLELVRFEETLQGPGFTATNLYWADPQTGFIWKSRQYLGPDQAVEIQQLKPYLAKNS